MILSNKSHLKVVTGHACRYAAGSSVGWYVGFVIASMAQLTPYLPTYIQQIKAAFIIGLFDAIGIICIPLIEYIVKRCIDSTIKFPNTLYQLAAKAFATGIAFYYAGQLAEYLHYGSLFSLQQYLIIAVLTGVTWWSVGLLIDVASASVKKNWHINFLVTLGVVCSEVCWQLGWDSLHKMNYSALHDLAYYSTTFIITGFVGFIIGGMGYVYARSAKYHN